MRFNEEQLRVLENLAVAYDNWMAAERELLPLNYRLQWKSVSGRDYLYRIRDREGNGNSLGPRSAKTEKMHAEFTATKQPLADRASASLRQLRAMAPVYRALRLPLLTTAAGEVIREADRRGLLGVSLLVIGTTTMAAYELEAQTRFATGLDSTQDCDFTWAGEPKTTLALSGETGERLLDMLKAVDASYTVNLERPFQARNRDAFEVEILMAPSLARNYPAAESIRPLQSEEQEWLLRGQTVSQVVFDRSGLPARIVAPDPRWMALHKLFIAGKPDRNSRKVEKDRKQGAALLMAIREYMPHYPIDAAFLKQLPLRLRALIGD